MTNEGNLFRNMEITHWKKTLFYKKKVGATAKSTYPSADLGQIFAGPIHFLFPAMARELLKIIVSSRCSNRESAGVWRCGNLSGMIFPKCGEQIGYVAARAGEKRHRK